MKKAFIFDVDGVLINDEKIWNEAETSHVRQLFGDLIFNKIGSTVGIDLNTIYNKAVSYGSKVPKKEYLDMIYGIAPHIYQTAPLTSSLSKLGQRLVDLGYVMGAVSASPAEWVNIVLNRLTFGKHIKVVVSLPNRLDLRHKPFPDGYIEAMKQLQVEPERTLILEDSNAGIASAKGAKAYVIGFKENLVKDYIQQGADIYAQTIQEVIGIVDNFTKNLK